MCAHIIGRYWRMGFYNKAPFYIQEKQPQQDDKESLMLLFTDGNWWLVQPGYGKKETVYLAQSDWPARVHMMEGDASQQRRSRLCVRHVMFQPWSVKVARLSGVHVRL